MERLPETRDECVGSKPALFFEHGQEAPARFARDASGLGDELGRQVGGSVECIALH